MNVNIITVSGGSEILQVQHAETDIIMLRHNSVVETVDGTLHDSIRGYRYRMRFWYDQSIEPDAYISVFNNILSDILGGQSSISIIFDGKGIAAIPSSDFLLSMQYSQTIGIFSPRMEFLATNNNINLFSRYVDEGYVNESYV